MAGKYVSSCRGCLAKVGSEDMHSFVWPEIKELFEDCTAIEIPDDRVLPRQICSECLSKCEQWHAFKRMCNDINDHLQGFLAKDEETKTIIKDECAGKEKQMTIKDECVEEANITCSACSDVEDDDDLDEYTFGELVVDTDEEDESLQGTPEDDSTNKSDMTCSTESLASKDEPSRSRNYIGPINCPVCQKELSSRSALHVHFVKHTSERPYQCTYCSDDFTTKYIALAHKHKEHPDEPKEDAVSIKKDSIFHSKRPWEEVDCSALESAQKTKNVQRGDSGDAKPKGTSPQMGRYCYVKCPVCQQLMQQGNLKPHFVVHTQERPYMCTYCNEDFRMKQIAKQHVFAKHPGKPVDECAVVLKKGSIFESTRPWEAMGYYIEMQRRPRRSAEEKEEYGLVKCPVCKKLIQRNDLRRHFVVHTNERPYVCSYCDMDFRKKQNASNHVQKKHPGHSTVDGGVVIKKGSIFESLRPWEAMGYTVDEYSNEGHAEEDENTRKAEKILFCPLCEKTFKRKRYLKEHIYNHQRGDRDTQVESSKGN